MSDQIELPIPFRYDGIEFIPCPKYGAYYGVSIEVTPNYSLRPALLQIAMQDDGQPEMRGGLPNIVEVTNIDGDDMFLADINSTLRTVFIHADFPGR